MRILLVTNEKGLRGGERQVQLLAAGLEALGHSVALVAPPSAALLQDQSRPRFAVAMANELDLRAVLGLRRAAASFQPDLVHAFSSRAHALLALARIRKPLVVTRAVAFPAGSGPLGRRKYQRGVDGFIAVSAFVKEVLLESGAEPGLVEVIAPGVPTRLPNHRAAAALRAELTAPGSWVLGSIGALEPSKGFELLVRALPRMKSGGVAAELLLLGQGPEGEALHRLAVDLGVQNQLHLLSGDTSVEAVLGAADAFVSTSVREGFGMAIVEAMGAGVPVIATDSGGVRDILRSGENGVLLKDRDPEHLAAAVIELRRCSLDRQLGARIEAARQTAGHFGVSHMVERTVALYEKIIARASP